MAPSEFPSCSSCLKRGRERGGNGGCHFRLAERGEFERGVRRCPQHKLGDRRRLLPAPSLRTGEPIALVGDQLEFC